MTLLQITEPPTPATQKTVIGIDFGTTNTVVAVANNHNVQVIADAKGRTLIPSLVHMDNQGYHVGHALQQHPDAVWSVKRYLGRSLSEIAHPHPQARELDGHIYFTDTSALELAAQILHSARQQAEEYLGIPVDAAVVTVPAYFDDSQRLAVKDACRLAKLEVLRLINEPTAAALAYTRDIQPQGKVLVYDFGGGTFDVTILKRSQGLFQVLATNGDTALGGDDIDTNIVRLLAKQHGLPMDDAAQFNQLRLCARALKQQLSTAAQASCVWNTTTLRLSTEQLQGCSSACITRTLTLVQAALKDAKVTIDQLDEVILVGGSTRMPSVAQAVTDFFHTPPLCTHNPDHVVAIGAALQAQMLQGGGGAVLLDVLPLSLGVETMGGLMEKIIQRNTPIPIQRAQQFTTYKDGQTAIRLSVYQGERELVTDCRKLGVFSLGNIPPLPAGQAKIEVEFRVDADGLLVVSATELSTNTSTTLAVQPTYGLREEQITKMLAAAIDHAQHDVEQRQLREAIVDAESIIQACEKAVASDGDLLTDDELAIIQPALSAAKATIDKNDRAAIEQATQHLITITDPFAAARMNRGVQRALTGQTVDAIAAHHTTHSKESGE